MLKFYFASFIACFLMLNANAQKKQNVYFLKDDGRYVTVKDSADFVRVVQEPDSGSVLYNVLEYYLNGNPKTIGKSSTINPIIWEGSVNSYYPNKKRKQIARIEKSHFLGPVYDYYPNGKLYRSTGLSHNSYPVIAKNPVFVADEVIYSVNDSTGAATVTDGNGYYKMYDQDFKYIKEEGAVKNNKREGIWKGFSSQGKLIFTEEFEDGKFVKGMRTDEKGDTIKYAVKEALPKFKGKSDIEFNNYVASTVVYPRAAVERNSQGEIAVRFSVDTDGSVADIKIFKSLDVALDSVVVNVLKKSPRWTPAIQNGIPVKVDYDKTFGFGFSREIHFRRF